ncbi:nucleoside triphosphate pyrophosphohydrolase [Paenibacillus sp. YYML68]|uniref:nucleoside triphosphate pyrophosphohydrolase n=1 Tax=Paenibacillus sp. YYML68 TaxID=2909250 RepID=UPI00249179B0|nr:nucleoside triphosphate pyrophosphohydrolase [Paenibacillus sp. YYML68]
MPVYNKLVRDRIPEVIEASGKQCRTRLLEEAEYKRELIAKLHEELQEYTSAQESEHALEELADLLEVIRALSEVHGSTWEQLDALRQRKADARGGFRDRVYLIDVEDRA